MPGGSNSLFIIILIVAMVALMWWQSRKSKQQQQKIQDFRASLQPGELVQTIGGVIGKVVSVDTKYEEIVIDSEGSQLRFTFRAISKKYERPAFIDDDEVDEDGNPIVNEDEGSSTGSEDPANSTTDQTLNSNDQAQKPFDDEGAVDQKEQQSDDDASMDDTSAEGSKAEEDSSKNK